MVRQHPLVTLESVLLVAIGGALGANARYLVGTVVTGLGGTFVANVVGCYLLGFLVYERKFAGLISEPSRLVFATGFLSSFTTYSTFALEVVQSPIGVGAGYAAVSYAAGFAAVLAGRTTARLIAGEATGVTGE